MRHRIEPKPQTFGLKVLGVVTLVWIMAMTLAALARDLDGRYAQSPLKQWFDQLKSGKGLCCSFADGFSVRDVDWDTDGGHYRVRLDGQWIAVPDDAVIGEPNRFGPAVVWPIKGAGGEITIRCFMPGAGT